MSQGYGANSYKKTAVTTANRGQVLLMLYEGAIQNVKKATAAIEQKKIAEKGTAIGKAHDIINELMNCLDHNTGGDIARDLERLYHFMTEQLIRANMASSSDPASAKDALGVVQKLLETLLDGWRGAVEQVNKGIAK
jgi:flagellar secretion chaperone FliS